jgi:hypothetical protein
MSQFVADGLVTNFSHSEPDDHAIERPLAINDRGAAQMLARVADGDGGVLQFWKQLQRALDHLVGAAGKPLFHLRRESNGHLSVAQT